MSFTVLIPARMASSRLPNKPLADIAGIPMVVRVAQRVLTGCTSHGAVRVVVAADSPRIITACQAYGVDALLTRTDHASGSDRLAEACGLLGLTDDQIVVNVQGDEPLIDPRLVCDVANILQFRPDIAVSTAAHPMTSLAEFHNPHVVKVVVDASATALYFSRAPIPCPRDAMDTLPSPPPLRHIGLYAYRVGFLRQFPHMAQAPLEITESLEQLRILWHGYRIVVHTTFQATARGVDTADDLAHVCSLIASDSH